MGELFINVSGGGGISDDITARQNDVLKGKTAITSDSDDEIVEGTLELTGNAAVGHVEVGKTFYNTNAHSKQTGTLRNATNDTSVKHASNNTTKVIKGDAAYLSVNTDGVARAEIRFNEPRGVIESNTLVGVPQGTMAAAGGLGAGKLLQGQSAFGISGTATSDANAGPGDLLSGKTAYVKGNKVTGTMPNRGAVNQSLNASGSYTIPAGYHNGKGKITASSLSSQTGGSAGAGDILSGKTAWVNGSKVTGTMVNRGSTSSTLNAGSSYTIPSGYHNGQGKVTASSLSSQTSADASASHILSGKTAWVNGSKVTGTMANRGSYTSPVSIAWGSGNSANNLYVRIPQGAYLTNTTAGSPEIQCSVGQAKTVSPSSSAQTVYADNGKILQSVTVKAISNYMKPFCSPISTSNLKISKPAGDYSVTTKIPCANGCVINMNGVWIAISKGGSSHSISGQPFIEYVGMDSAGNVTIAVAYEAESQGFTFSVEYVF